MTDADIHSVNSNFVDVVYLKWCIPHLNIFVNLWYEKKNSLKSPPPPQVKFRRYASDIESLSNELLSATGQNTLFNILCRAPSGDMKPFENFMRTKLSKTENSNKQFHILILIYWTMILMKRCKIF